MNDFDDVLSPEPAPCPNCGTPVAPGAIYCPDCGARVVPDETARRPLKVAWFPLLLTLPAISILALGSCLAVGGVVGGALFLNWKIAAMSAAVLIVAVLTSYLFRFLNRP